MENTECILWDGRRWAQGRYGMDVLNGKSMGAHRAAWIRANGLIPPGLVVCHKCDNGLCINIDHLFLGTMSMNMRDCLWKGRLKTNLGDQSGSNNNNARSDYAIVRKFAKRLRKEGKTYSEIKNILGIKSNGHLRKILIT